MSAIVVTGALGHIGSRFIRTLKPGQFDRVALVDNLLTLRFPSLFDLPEGVPYEFLELDVTTADLERTFAGAHAVVHLAAITDAASSFGNAAAVERVNLQGTERVARACAAVDARMIFLSTTSVYGTQGAVVDEECPVSDLKPQSPYAESKLQAERMLAQLRNELGLRHVTFRFGTIFGASVGMRFHTAVNKFIWQACMGDPLTVWSTALDQKRPYLDLEDAVAALHFALKHDLFDGRVFNVLTLNATVREIIDTVRRFVPHVAVNLVDHAIMNQLSYEVSCDRFKSLGFEFAGDLARSIGASVALLRSASGLSRRSKR